MPTTSDNTIRTTYLVTYVHDNSAKIFAYIAEIYTFVVPQHMHVDCINVTQSEKTQHNVVIHNLPSIKHMKVIINVLH